ncbi:hypothetical protein PQ469_06305 [Mucilaginibacter sp. KACC 22773]|uniref:hypothetical protein n=1 Tax=Mucilaginibacter sp. KACC 22773 TaxID=3025671 RepID=UPI0023667333|nr:hypothetical protein [Mucilaginibacter sp. KACC 22773]WDF79616.1 hypothetical protein PQ469_06305 [Mucilaginibacter sp. KACC 22773]
MLQNRVSPHGDIIKTSARGAWIGNRGQLHGNTKTILRPFKLKAWITCLLQFKGRHREVMSPGLWTELFFLDEATAFAAGHRPCFECRRDDANKFKTAWLKGNPEYGFDKKTAIGKIDEITHQERIDKSGNKVTFDADVQGLPNGTFIQVDGESYLVSNSQLYHWTPAGYEKPGLSIKAGQVTVLTPRSTVNAFSAGYLPQIAL